MKIEKLLPYEDYTLTTTLSSKEAGSRIQANIQPKNDSLFSALTRVSTKPYEGYVDGNRFEIRRIISYRNSFLPVITGDISGLNGPINIHIKMKPKMYTLAIWYVIVVVAGLGMISFYQLFEKENTVPGFLINGYVLALLLVFLLSAPVIFFKIESKKAKNFLAGLLTDPDGNMIYIDQHR